MGKGKDFSSRAFNGNCRGQGLKEQSGGKLCWFDFSSSGLVNEFSETSNNCCNSSSNTPCLAVLMSPSPKELRFVCLLKVEGMPGVITLYKRPLLPVRLLAGPMPLVPHHFSLVLFVGCYSQSMSTRELLWFIPCHDEGKRWKQFRSCRITLSGLCSVG